MADLNLDLQVDPPTSLQTAFGCKLLKVWAVPSGWHWTPNTSSGASVSFTIDLFPFTDQRQGQCSSVLWVPSCHKALSVCFSLLFRETICALCRWINSLSWKPVSRFGKSVGIIFSEEASPSGFPQVWRNINGQLFKGLAKWPRWHSVGLVADVCTGLNANLWKRNFIP
jgi:hypothetical protein